MEMEAKLTRPNYYRETSLECIDAMRLAYGSPAVEAFILCNAFKYLWRHNNKNGLEDVLKAEEYLKILDDVNDYKFNEVLGDYTSRFKELKSLSEKFKKEYNENADKDKRTKS